MLRSMRFLRATVVFALFSSAPLVGQSADLAAVERSKLEGIRILVQQCRPLPRLPMSDANHPTPIDRAMAEANARSIAQALRNIKERIAQIGTAGFATEAGAAEYTSQLMQLFYCYYGDQMDRATSEAIRGGVGTEVSWRSEADPGISGSSTVSGEERLADGHQCLTVSDVVIIDGEESRVSKRMCRAPGASAYVKA